MFSINKFIRIASFVLGAAWLSISSTRAVELVGYVPYYRLNSNYLNNTLPDQLSLLDEVRYFGLTVNSSGGISSLEGSLTSQKNNIAAIKSIIEGLPVGQRPRLDITLGGADVDGVFSSIAASSSLQATLAQNIAALLNETGATAVDIDWEHPGPNGPFAGPPVEISTTYPALLKRIKQEVGANKRVYATVDPSVVINNNVLSGPDAIDGISLMTYDLGWWNDSSNPNDREHSLHEYVEDSVDAWTDPLSANTQRPHVWSSASWGNNVPADKLGVGLPFYGRNIFTDAAYTYAELVTSGTPTGNGYYTLGGQSIWIPDQADIEDRIQLAHDEGLQNVFIWELGQDLHPTNPNSMLKIAADKLASLTLVPGDFNGDTFVDGTDLAQWQGGYGINNEGDADGDGDSDGRDFLIWQRNFSPDNEVLTAAATAVPEPSSALLILWAGCLLLNRRR